MAKLNSTAWQALVKHHQDYRNRSLQQLFATDGKGTRAEFRLSAAGLDYDYSRQRVSKETLELLLELAHESGLEQAIADFGSGKTVNITEQRQALHMQLREPVTTEPLIIEGLHQLQNLSTELRASTCTDIIVLGIGGSDLGPRLAYEALSAYNDNRFNLHFIANCDPDTLLPVLERLDAKRTIAIISSKSFTTLETLSNATLVKEFLADNSRLYALTAASSKAQNFGVPLDNILSFGDYIGGRYSIWSVIALPIVLSIGFDNFKAMLAGAHAMDKHFLNSDFTHNMPVIMALIGIWNNNFNNYSSQAIIPYADKLRLLPEYLQQLEMESNGKAANCQTCPVIWGGVGTNVQHAFMQLLQQGTQVVPVDFIMVRNSNRGGAALQSILLASCKAQADALCFGVERQPEYKSCSGDRPSSIIELAKVEPASLGALLALYEHKVFVQAHIWQINPFDQWGVELGKQLTREYLANN